MLLSKNVVTSLICCSRSSNLRRLHFSPFERFAIMNKFTLAIAAVYVALSRAATEAPVTIAPLAPLTTAILPVGAPVAKGGMGGGDKGKNAVGGMGGMGMFSGPVFSVAPVTSAPVAPSPAMGGMGSKTLPPIAPTVSSAPVAVGGMGGMNRGRSLLGMGGMGPDSESVAPFTSAPVAPSTPVAPQGKSPGKTGVIMGDKHSKEKRAPKDDETSASVSSAPMLSETSPPVAVGGMGKARRYRGRTL